MKHLIFLRGYVTPPKFYSNFHMPGSNADTSNAVMSSVVCCMQLGGGGYNCTDIQLTFISTTMVDGSLLWQTIYISPLHSVTCHCYIGWDPHDSMGKLESRTSIWRWYRAPCKVTELNATIHEMPTKTNLNIAFHECGVTHLFFIHYEGNVVV